MRRRRARTPLALAVALTVLGVGPAVAAPPTSAPPASASAPAVTLGTPVFSLRRVPGVLSGFAADTHLGTDLDALMTDPALAGGRDHACLAVAENGGTVTHYARLPGMKLIPASTMKLLTTTAALAQLGPDTTFTTEIRAGAPPADGAVGDLFMVGGGDPLLSTADFALDGGYLGQPRRSTSMEALADKVVATGVRRIGRILGDESRYDTARQIPSWAPSYLTEFEITPLSALVVNKAFTAERPPAVAASPPAHAASVLAGLLRARGVTVGSTSAAKAPAGAPLLTSIQSAPLRDVVGEILQNSDNMGAEMLVKELGAKPGVPGTTAAGLAVVAAQLQQVAGIGAGDVSSVDGSGLDRSDRLSCDVLQKVLVQAGDAGPLGQGLPVAGQNGTLYKRFLGPTAGKVRAKTGSLDGVSALSGFETARDGRTLTFSLIANELPNTSTGGALEDKVVSVLAGYPRGPATDELAPRPVGPPSG
ncbi:MAG: D-alanyl-D-alanine carboxypeptidase/D-alanyl-D-alanine-endopeptidase [Actinomycetota bacterium]|nr:D-alanyl-D-alanine carboxypeptidase/D-alanyl-D-alanine-endopeptidase [Actinomycetota bacterium]